MLRPEFIRRKEFSKQSFLGENVKNYLNKQKLPKNIEDGLRQLESCEKLIAKIAEELVRDLEETEEMFVSS